MEVLRERVEVQDGGVPGAGLHGLRRRPLRLHHLLVPREAGGLAQPLPPRPPLGLGPPPHPLLAEQLQTVLPLPSPSPFHSLTQPLPPSASSRSPSWSSGSPSWRPSTTRCSRPPSNSSPASPPSPLASSTSTPLSLAGDAEPRRLHQARQALAPHSHPPIPSPCVLCKLAAVLSPLSLPSPLRDTLAVSKAYLRRLVNYRDAVRLDL